MKTPVEETRDGFYIHERDEMHPGGTRVLRLDNEAREETKWVFADDFMAVQKERDDYRRTLALINAHVIPGGDDYYKVVTLLRDAGFSARDAKAMRELIAEVASWPTSTTAPEALPKSSPLPVSASSVEARQGQDLGAASGVVAQEDQP